VLFFCMSIWRQSEKGCMISAPAGLPNDPSRALPICLWNVARSIRSTRIIPSGAMIVLMRKFAMRSWQRPVIGDPSITDLNVQFSWSVSLLSLFAACTTVDRVHMTLTVARRADLLPGFEITGWAIPSRFIRLSPRAGLRRLSGKLYTLRDRIAARIIP
jgi:hypothetical protein